MKSQYRIVTPLIGTLLAAATLAARAAEASSPGPAVAAPTAQPAAVDLGDQLQDLRAQIARLEAALEQNHQRRSPARPAGHTSMGRMRGPGAASAADGSMKAKPPPSRGVGRPSDAMAGRKKMAGMGVMKKPAMKPAESVPAAPGMARGMGMMKKPDMGKMKMMGMMGRMKGMGGMPGMSRQSALPGFPGASHLYHIGATGFFLDHAAHLQLTAAQQARLNQIREKTALAQATADRRIEQAEQELWELTAADQPDARKIETKIRELERLRGDQRLAFIRSVGEAAGVLTHEQHVALTGSLPPAGSIPK